MQPLIPQWPNTVYSIKYFSLSIILPHPPSPCPFFSLLPRMHHRLSRLSWAIKRHSMGEGGLPCSRNCADTHTRGSRDGSPLHWDLDPQHEREVSTEDKGSIEEEHSGNGSALSLTAGENREMSERKSVDMQSGQGCLMEWSVRITEDYSGTLPSGLSQHFGHTVTRQLLFCIVQKSCMCCVSATVEALKFRA